MTVTPVGMRCPECARDRTKVKRPTGAPTRSDAPATYALIGLCVASFLVQIATGGTLFDGGGGWSREGSLFGPLVAEGEPYRIVTSAFLHAGIIHLGLNMFILYLLGTMLEPTIGTPRFAALYAVSLIGGSTGALLLEPDAATVGASGAVFGVMAAAFFIARDRGLDQLASQVGILLVLNLVFTFRPGISVGGHIGGLVVGAIAALAMLAIQRNRLPRPGLLQVLAFAAVGVVALVVALIAAEDSLPPGFG
jgi:membrane associated rhomboid family serine protease